MTNPLKKLARLVLARDILYIRIELGGMFIDAQDLTFLGDISARKEKLKRIKEHIHRTKRLIEGD